MQINGTSSGPTMAASEPPEPPPRNPDRINASLHKLSESKNVKSLDSSIATIPEKSINNNKPLKTILSLDNNITSTTTSLATSAASTLTITASAKNVIATAPPAAATTAIVATGSSSLHTTSAILFSKRNDITQISGGGIDIGSPLSSNGSNHTLISLIPMTIDNQLQQQQQQQARLSFLNQSDTHSKLMSQQQQQQNGGGTQQRIGGILSEQQLINGTISSSSGSGSTGSNVGSTINGTSTALNSITAAPNYIHTQATTAVDKKNANDVCSIVKLMDFEATTLTAAAPSTTATTLITKRDAITMVPTLASISSSTFNSSSSCDGNRNDDSKFHFQSDSPTKLREENERLNAEIFRLRKLFENSPEGAVGGIDLSDSNSCGDAQSTDGSGGTPQQRFDRLESELRSAKSQLMTLRIERKKLRSDKSELLAQVKQLCASLQDKEQELRDFIRNFQDRVRETESNNAKLTGDRERERWQLLKQARDEAERSLALAQQLSSRDMQLQRLQDQLQEARRQLSGCLSDQESVLSFAPLTPPSTASGLLNQMAVAAAASSMRSTDDSGRGNSNSLSAFSSSLSGGSGATAGDRNSCLNDSAARNSSDRDSTGGDLNFSDGACENGPCITVDPDSISLVSSQNMYQFGTPKERSPTLSPLNSAAYSRSVEQLGSPVDPEGPGLRKFAPKTGTLGVRNGRGGTWGSISRVFARSRNKNKALSADGSAEYSDYSWNPLSEEGYAEKLRLLRDASQLPMERWRASQVLAWLEVALGMPQYSTRCAENVKSGKVLLELNDTELEAGLGLAHPMHRKKLRLAIEEQRRPEMVRYPMITQLGHTWVASEWLPDIGLPQYADTFLHSLVDARMLDTLSKKELEKFLGVTRKFHQASIVHGIHVLRIVKYDRQTLAMRRVQSETVDADPIVWTNQRFIRWARSIDLGEYADNLKDSGVHGGLVVLEPSFSGDTMATALGIPPSKNIIRRHLTTEFDALILPARSTLGQGIRSGCGIVPITGPGGLQHYATTDRRSSSALRISAWKGSQSSLSKAFRFNAKPSRSGGSIGDRSSFGNSTSPTPSYSSSEGGGGIYATIGPTHYPPPTTAPPLPPIISSNYGPPGHRVSAPPAGGISALESISDSNLLYEQHRRVKSISDIGMTAAVTNRNAGIGMGSCGGVGDTGSGGSGSVDGASASSNSPV